MLELILNELYIQLCIIAAIYIAIIFFVSADLWSGTRKAKKRGEFRSSYGLRKTISKAATYFNVVIVLTVMDALIMLLLIKGSISVPVFPYLTLLGGLVVGLIECKSIYEKAEDKEKVRAAEAVNLLATIVKNREDLDAVMKLLKQKTNEKM